MYPQQSSSVLCVGFQLLAVFRRRCDYNWHVCVLCFCVCVSVCLCFLYVNSFASLRSQMHHPHLSHCACAQHFDDNTCLGGGGGAGMASAGCKAAGGTRRAGRQARAPPQELRRAQTARSTPVLCISAQAPAAQRIPGSIKVQDRSR